jgi:hypothetical protein
VVGRVSESGVAYGVRSWKRDGQGAGDDAGDIRHDVRVVESTEVACDHPCRPGIRLEM